MAGLLHGKLRSVNGRLRRLEAALAARGGRPQAGVSLRPRRRPCPTFSCKLQKSERFRIQSWNPVAKRH